MDAIVFDERGEAYVREIDRRLRAYGTPRHGNRDDPLDELLYIILSAQTEEYLYTRTFRRLWEAFPKWRGLDEADQSTLSLLIREGGLGVKKAHWIKEAVRKIKARTGELSLGWLAELDDFELEAYLLSVPGVGLKSAKCIMMYSLGRQVFPVDTHVWRVCRRLGLAPARAKPIPRLERELESRIPPDIRYTLHVNVISHGRLICVPSRLKCGDCILAELCPSAFADDTISAGTKVIRASEVPSAAEVNLAP